MNMEESLYQACRAGELRLLDLHLGRLLARLAPKTADLLLLSGTLLSAAMAQGHTCLRLDRPDPLPRALRPLLPSSARAWQTDLLESGVTALPGQTAPLVLDREYRLYTFRFFHIEQRIATDLLTRAKPLTPVDPERVRPVLDRLFPGSGPDDQQMQAALLALLKPLLIISGGPGTGKTHTVARILALLNATGPALQVSLAAPTGKAATRLEESLRKAVAGLPPDLANGLPRKAQTLHRLLGYHPDQRTFHHTGDRPLTADLLVLDEASMVDLVLMDHLLAALRPETRLILLGDPDQLASVEAGRLFADLRGPKQKVISRELGQTLAALTGSSQQTAPSDQHLGDCVIQLHTSYRFSGKSGLAALARAVNSGDMAAVTAVLGQDWPDLCLQTQRGPARQKWLQQTILEHLRPLFAAQTPGEALALINGFRVLCALRQGPDGVEGVNRLAETAFAEEGLIPAGTSLYRGRPLLITRNSYELDLYNGDTGILWPNDSGRLRAWFPDRDGSLRSVSPGRLPAHETGYAITIHKAQGSEFDRVLLLLPEQENRLLNRELLYTGLTRARKSLTLCAEAEILAATVEKRGHRFSGLAQRLWPGWTSA